MGSPSPFWLVISDGPESQIGITWPFQGDEPAAILSTSDCSDRFLHIVILTTSGHAYSYSPFLSGKLLDTKFTDISGPRFVNHACLTSSNLFLVSGSLISIYAVSGANYVLIKSDADLLSPVISCSLATNAIFALTQDGNVFKVLTDGSSECICRNILLLDSCRESLVYIDSSGNKKLITPKKEPNLNPIVPFPYKLHLLNEVLLVETKNGVAPRGTKETFIFSYCIVGSSFTYCSKDRHSILSKLKSSDSPSEVFKTQGLIISHSELPNNASAVLVKDGFNDMLNSTKFDLGLLAEFSQSEQISRIEKVLLFNIIVDNLDQFSQLQFLLPIVDSCAKCVEWVLLFHLFDQSFFDLFFAQIDKLSVQNYCQFVRALGCMLSKAPEGVANALIERKENPMNPSKAVEYLKLPPSEYFKKLIERFYLLSDAIEMSQIFTVLEALLSFRRYAVGDFTRLSLIFFQLCDPKQNIELSASLAEEMVIVARIPAYEYTTAIFAALLRLYCAFVEPWEKKDDTKRGDIREIIFKFCQKIVFLLGKAVYFKVIDEFLFDTIYDKVKTLLQDSHLLPTKIIMARLKALIEVNVPFQVELSSSAVTEQALDEFHGLDEQLACIVTQLQECVSSEESSEWNLAKKWIFDRI